LPALPYQWNVNSPVSPTNLNYSLYSFLNANPFYPTGVAFHARKPVYKAVSNAPVSVGSGDTGYPFQGQGAANVVIDSSGDYGAQLDPPQWGSIESTLPGAAGGLDAGPGGGWFLLSAFIPIGPADTNGVTFSIDIQENGTDTSWGQNDLAADALPATPWTADLYSLGASTWTPVVSNGGATAYPTVVSTEGFERSVYFQGLWISVTAGVNPEFFPPAPKQNWSAGDQWTSQWANGPAGLVNVLEYLNYPPCMRADAGTATTSLPNETATVIHLPETGLDTWGAYNDTTYTWTCPADGLYLVIGIIVTAAEAMSLQCSARINGTDYWGPSNYCTGVFAGTAMKAQVFSLVAGDTVQLAGYQDSGSTIATITSHEPRLVIAWVGQPGVPGTPVNPNPYFSQGSLTGWNGFGGALTAVAESALPYTPYPWVASFTPNSTVTSASAEESAGAFTATPGAWYGISAWVNASGTTNTLIGFDWTNSGTYVSTTAATAAPSTGNWVLLQTIQQAPASGINSGYCRVGRSSAGNVGTSAAMLIAGVQAAEVGTGQPSPPDLTYRYVAGTPAAEVAGVFNDHLANDLAFLVWRPYLLSYQTISNSVTDNFSTPVPVDTITGIVHGDYGDNYGGWSAGSDNYYVAQAAGWYLVVAEVFVTANSGADYPMVQAGIQVSTAPSAHFDFYELHVVPASPAADVPGAAAMGLYYLNEGDYVFPGVAIENYPAPADTYVTAGHRSHFEVVWVSE
jgi:hypothetical protein